METVIERGRPPEKRSRSWRGAWPAALLAALCLAFFWEALWLSESHTILGDDATNLFVPWLRYAVSSVRNGGLPLWNPHFFAGIPFVANPQPAIFYPPTWLALAMPVTRALGLIAVLHLWLAGVGMYAWLRSEKTPPLGALFGATVFSFSGYFMVRVRGGHLGVVTTGAWLPCLLWAYRGAVARRDWRIAILGGLPVGMAVLAGHTASFLYVALALAVYALFYALKGWQQKGAVREAALPLALVGTMLLVGLAVAAVQLLPTAELVTRSTRQAASSYDFAARFSWPPGYILTLLVPNFFGEPSHTGYWGDGIYDEFIYYVGILPLLLALLAPRMRHRLKPFLLTLGLGGLLLAFGQYGGLHRLFFRFVPLFRVMRAPARAGFLFTLAAAGLAGLLVGRLGQSPEEERKRLLSPLRRRWVLIVAGGASLLVLASFVAFGLERDTNPSVGRLWHAANQTALFLVAFLAASGLLLYWRDAEHPWSSLAWVALGLVLLDLWTFGNSVIQVKEVEENAYWRIVSKAVTDPQAGRVLPWGLNEAEQNGGLAYGLRSVFGYDPLILQRYETFITSRPDPLARTYDLLNAGYLVTTAPQEFAEAPDTPQLVLEEAGVYVYRRPAALPPAWVAARGELLEDGAALARIHDPDFDPRTTAILAPEETDAVACAGPISGHADEAGSEIDILTYARGRIEARVRSNGGWLVFSETFYPGWRAAVDGKNVPLVRADYVLRALCVPEGEHAIAMVYDPPLFKGGLAITGLALLLIAGVAVWLRREQGAAV